MNSSSIFYKLFFCFLVYNASYSQFVHAYDMGQYLDGQSKDDDYISKKFKELNQKSSFISGENKDNEKELDQAAERQRIDGPQQGVLNVPAPEMKTELNNLDKVLGQEGHLQGFEGKKEHYVEPQLEAEIKQIRNDSSSNFSFFIGKDDYHYKSQNDTFKKTFRRSKDSQIKANKAELPIFLRFSTQKFLNNTFLGRLGLGVSLGFGLNSGKGQFADGQFSHYNIMLWTIPLDLAAVYELTLFSQLKIGAAAGPSTLGLIQHRKDIDSGDDRKVRRQYSWGYFGEVFARYDITSSIASNPARLMSQFSITRILLSLSLRSQEYSHFQTPGIEISGQSFAIGLTYELL